QGAVGYGGLLFTTSTDITTAAFYSGSAGDTTLYLDAPQIVFENLAETVQYLTLDPTAALFGGFIDWATDRGFTAPATGGRLQWNSGSGVALSGTGATYDLGLRNATGVSVLLIPHNSTQALFTGSICLNPGTAPSAPTNGELWYD